MECRYTIQPLNMKSVTFGKYQKKLQYQSFFGGWILCLQKSHIYPVIFELRIYMLTINNEQKFLKNNCSGLPQAPCQTRWMQKKYTCHRSRNNFKNCYSSTVFLCLISLILWKISQTMYVRLNCKFSKELYLKQANSFIILHFCTCCLEHLDLPWLLPAAVSIIFSSNICWDEGKCASYNIRNIFNTN